MSEKRQEDLWALELSDFFIKKFKYQLITLNKETQELWLVNAKHDTYPILVVTTQTTDTLDFMTLEHHRKALAMLLHTAPNGLNFSVNDASILSTSETIIATDTRFSKPEIESVFPGITKLLQPTKNVSMATQRVSKSIRKNMTKLRRMNKISSNIVTLGLTVILTFMFGLTYYIANKNNVPFIYGLLYLGAYQKSLIVQYHQYYRFIMPMFLHGSIIHLLMNVISMRNLGVVLEKEMGSWRYLITIVMGTLFGTAFLFIRNDPAIVVGISAGIYALLGLLIVLFFEKDLLKNRMIRMNLISTILLNLYISLMPNVSMTGHLGGLYVGVILGFIFSKREDWNGIRTMGWIILASSILFIGYMMIQTANIMA